MGKFLNHLPLQTCSSFSKQFHLLLTNTTRRSHPRSPLRLTPALVPRKPTKTPPVPFTSLGLPTGVRAAAQRHPGCQTNLSLEHSSQGGQDAASGAGGTFRRPLVADRNATALVPTLQPGTRDPRRTPGPRAAGARAAGPRSAWPRRGATTSRRLASELAVADGC